MSASVGPSRRSVLALGPDNHRVTTGPLRAPAGWAVVESRVSGVCATDVHILDGRVAGARMPVVLGHEGAGVVIEVPRGYDALRAGERVVLYSPLGCGSCLACGAGGAACSSPRGQLGFSLDGTFADTWAAPPENLVRIPDEVSFETAAPLGCAGITALHAVARSGVRAGESVLVHGVGGVGLMAIQAAVAAGARVTVVADASAKAELATEAGAERVLVVPQEGGGRLAEALHDAVGVAGVAHFIDFVGSAASLTAGLQVLAPSGTVVVAATQGEMVTVDPALLLRKEARMVGTLAGSRDDLVAALEMAVQGRFRVQVDQRIPIGDVGVALDRIRAREALGRNLLVW